MPGNPPDEEVQLRAFVVHVADDAHQLAAEVGLVAARRQRLTGALRPCPRLAQLARELEHTAAALLRYAGA